MTADPSAAPPASLRLVATVALVWNLMGVAAFTLLLTMSEDALAELPPAEAALYTNTPTWATAAYAVAVFAGTVASLGLLLRRVWAVPLFALSLVAIMVQMGHALFLSDLAEVKGGDALVLPFVIVFVAAGLLGYARLAHGRGWIG